MFQALSDILHLLKKPNKELLFLQFGDNAKNAITQLATILNTNLHQNLPAPYQSLLPPMVTTLEPPRVIAPTPPRVHNPVQVHPTTIMDKSTPTLSQSEFTLNKPTPNHHNTTLRSQNKTFPKFPIEYLQTTIHCHIHHHIIHHYILIMLSHQIIKLLPSTRPLTSRIQH